MRLGNILGASAWAEINAKAKEFRLAQEHRRKEEYERKRRRFELREAGFRPVKTAYDSWGGE